MIVAEDARTKATPSQLSFPTSPNFSMMGDWTSATMVLSNEKRNVDERMVTTISSHYSNRQSFSNSSTFDVYVGTYEWLWDARLHIFLNMVDILSCLSSGGALILRHNWGCRLHDEWKSKTRFEKNGVDTIDGVDRWERVWTEETVARKHAKVHVGRILT